MPLLQGSFRALFFFDVSEEIALDRVRGLVGAPPPSREPGFRRPVPPYVGYQNPPVMERLGELTVSGQTFQARIRYFDYGVASLEMERRFDADWPDLIALSGRLIGAPEIERAALEAATRALERIQSALVKPNTEWTTEDYYVVQLDKAAGEDGLELSGSQMATNYGPQISQIVRGESIGLSESEGAEVMTSSISYYPTDLLVVGWSAALLYDALPEGPDATVQLLEYANTQLLQFRYYDNVLTKVLARVYEVADNEGGLFSSWRMRGEAQRLNTIRLDVMELAERTDNAIKFLSDMFYARAYRLASRRIGVEDYRNLVEEKLRTAEDLYRFLMDEIHHGRAFVLELMVVIILIIDLVFLFKGKS